MNKPVFIFLLFICYNASAQNAGTAKKVDSYEAYMDSISNLVVGKKFPDFLAEFKDVPIKSNKDLENKVVFVNFWFANCMPCMAEMKGLNELYEKLKANPDFLFFSISFDPDTIVQKVTERFAIRYPVTRMSRDETKRLNFQNGYPTSFILDRKGIIRFFKLGGDIDEDNASDDVLKYIYPKIMEQLSAGTGK